VRNSLTYIVLVLLQLPLLFIHPVESNAVVNCHVWVAQGRCETTPDTWHDCRCCNDPHYYSGHQLCLEWDGSTREEHHCPLCEYDWRDFNLCCGGAGDPALAAAEQAYLDALGYADDAEGYLAALEDYIDDLNELLDTYDDGTNNAYYTSLRSSVEDLETALSDAEQLGPEAVQLVGAQVAAVAIMVDLSENRNGQSQGCKIGDPVYLASGVEELRQVDMSYDYLGNSIFIERTYRSNRTEERSAFGFGWSFNHGASLIVGRKAFIAERERRTAELKEDAENYVTAAAGYYQTATINKNNAEGEVNTIVGHANDISDKWGDIVDKMGQLQTAKNNARNAATSAQQHADDSANQLAQQYANDADAQALRAEGYRTAGNSKKEAVRSRYDGENIDGRTATVQGNFDALVIEYNDGTAHKNAIEAIKVDMVEEAAEAAAEARAEEARFPLDPYPEDETVYFGDDKVKIIDAAGTPIIYKWEEPLGVYSAYSDNGSYTGYVEYLGAGIFHQVAKTGEVRRFVDMGNGRSRLVSETDTNGNTVSYAYSGDNLISITDSVSRTTTLSYTNGLLTTVTDPLERAYSYGYDQNDRLILYTDPLGHQRRFEYDPDGHLTARIAPDGSRYEYQYDAEGRVEKERDQAGFEISYSYDMEARVTTMTDRLGRTTAHYFNEQHRLIRTVHPDGSEENYGYDQRNNRNLVIDELGNQTLTVYNLNNDPVELTDAAGNRVVMTYEPIFNKVASVTDKLGRTTSYSYDNAGNLSSINYPDGTTTSYSRNAQGLPTARTDQNGNTTIMRYDAYGNLSELEHPDGAKLSYTSDILGRVLAVTNETDDTTQYEYDALNQLTATIDPLGNRTEHQYDERSRRIVTIDAKGGRYQTVYDDRSDIIEQIDPLGRTTLQSYDGERQLIERTLANLSGFRLTRDARDRVIARTTFPGNRVTSYSYDAKGRRLATVDAENVETTTSYDVLDRPVAVTDGNGHTTTSEYDAVDNLTAIIDANNHRTSYSYDARNRQLSETNALGLTTSFSYDLAGNLTAKQKPDGAIINYLYTSRNQLSETRYPDGTTVTTSYDPAGRVTGQGNQTTSETRSYDARGLLVSVIDASLGEITYLYDELGNRTEVVDPDGGVQRSSYDLANRLISFTDPTGGTTSYSYDELNRVTEIALANGVRTSRSYDDDNRLQTVRTTAVDGTLLALFDYSYDAVGNRLTMTEEDGGITSYSYDRAYQLIEVDYPEGRQSDATGVGEIKALPDFERFSYDPVGNRLSLETEAGTTSYQYDQANRMVRGGDALYTYDTNGNRIAKGDAGLYAYHVENPDISYEYDYEDRLVRIVEDQLPPPERGVPSTIDAALISRKPPLQMVTSYAYDAAGRRVEKHSGPSFNGLLEGSDDDPRFERVRYLYDGLEVLHEHSSRQYHATAAYYRANGQLVAHFRYSDYYSFTDGNIDRMYLNYYSLDGLGSVATTSHYEDDTSSRYRYTAFGAIVQGDFSHNPYGYTSHRYDHENGFYHYHFRKYDPLTGTWLTPDPIGIAGGVNLYGFVRNNPVNFVDWLGLVQSAGELGIGNPGSYGGTNTHDSMYGSNGRGTGNDGGFWDSFLNGVSDVFGAIGRISSGIKKTASKAVKALQIVDYLEKIEEGKPIETVDDAREAVNLVTGAPGVVLGAPSNPAELNGGMLDQAFDAIEKAKQAREEALKECE
jgi:RHS repeat-associated protein